MKKGENIKNIGKKRAGIAILSMAIIISIVIGITACSGKPTAAVGDIIKLGGNSWRVLEVKDGKALVLSDKILSNMNYNEELPNAKDYTSSTDTSLRVTWEECTLREYLNGEFYDSAFSAEEKKQIITTEVKNNANPWWPRDGENDNVTTDKVFLLSIDEVVQYFGDSGDLERKDGTLYNMGMISDQFNESRIAQTQGGETIWWWLRSPGGIPPCSSWGITASSVMADGSLCVLGESVTNTIGGVRPALWLKLSGKLEILDSNEIKNNAAQIGENEKALSDTGVASKAEIFPEIKSDYMEITTQVVSEYASNCYFVTNKQTQETVIVDPGDDADILKSIVEENELKPVAILLTHSHSDHIGAAESLRSAFEIPIYAWIDEKDNFGEDVLVNNITWLDNVDAPLEIAGFSISAMYTPGHTIGSVCYYIESENVLFSGDTIFYGNYGRTDFSTGDSDAIINSIKNKVFILPDDTIVYSGHGRTTTISYEKEYNVINSLLQ